MENTEWLDKLKSQIVEAKDKENFVDLIKCYQNYLLRAGFVMAWLMLVESLKRKIVALADKEVKVAKETLSTIEGTEKAMHSNDEVIWKGAAKCDLISKEEESVIELLWKKRCIMSHPYMPQVKEADFRYMVENLVSISLAKTVMWSQNMIQDFFDDLKTSIFIIPNTIEERQEYAFNVLEQIPKKNWPFFWKTLFFEYSKSIDSGKKKYMLFLRRLASQFIQKTEVDINDPKYTLEKQMKSYCSVCWAIFNLRGTWKKLNKEYRGQLFRFLEVNEKDVSRVLYCAVRLVEKVDDLDEEYLNSYYQSLEKHDVLEMERFYVDKNLFLDRVYKDKIAEWQFYDQGEFVDWMKGMSEEEIEDFSPKQIWRLGGFLQRCCVNGTFKAQDFVKANHKEWVSRIDFVKGFVVENCTDNDGNLYLDVQKMDYSFRILGLLDEKHRLEVIAELDKLPNGKPNNDLDECYFIRHGMAQKYSEDSPEGLAFKKIVDKYYLAESE